MQDAIAVVKNPELFGRVFSGWYKNQTLKDVGYSILLRDKHTCKSCGIRPLPSRQRPDAMMLPVDLSHPAYAAVSTKNAITLCPICVSSMAVNWSLSTKYNSELGGTLIYAPNVKQSDINRLATFTCAVLASEPHTNPTVAIATDIYATFQGLNTNLRMNLPIYDGDDTDFCVALSLIPREHYELRQQIIEPVKYWASRSRWIPFYKYAYHSTIKGQTLEQLSLINDLQ